MNDQPESPKNANVAPAGTPEIQKTEPINPVAAEPETAEQLSKMEKEMSGFERATLKWAKVAVILSGLAALFVCLQWYEMHEGGSDTHDLAVAAKSQAAALHAAEKAKLTVGGPQVDEVHKVASVPLINSGPLPSGTANVRIHEATIAVNPPNSAPDLRNAIEHHWKHHVLNSVFTGSPFSLAVPVPAYSAEAIQAEKQSVVICAHISFNNGFPDDPTEESVLCSQTVYQTAAKRILWIPLEKSEAVLHEMEGLDGYPNNEEPD